MRSFTICGVGGWVAGIQINKNMCEHRRALFSDLVVCLQPSTVAGHPPHHHTHTHAKFPNRGYQKRTCGTLFLFSTSPTEGPGSVKIDHSLVSPFLIGLPVVQPIKIKQLGVRPRGQRSSKGRQGEDSKQ